MLILKRNTSAKILKQPMKHLHFLLLLFTSFTTIGQVTFDNTINKYFEKTCQLMDMSTQKTLKDFETKEQPWGIAIFTTYQIDTLNKEELRTDLSKISVYDVGSDIPNEPIEQNTYIPVPFLTELFKDTLHLVVGIPFPPNFHHYIFRQKVHSFYREDLEYDSVLRLDLNTSKVSTLDIPITTVKIKLSSSNYAVGKIIYGQVNFETASYYVDDTNFTHKFIQKRLRGEYVFKVQVQKKQTE